MLSVDNSENSRRYIKNKHQRRKTNKSTNKFKISIKFQRKTLLLLLLLLSLYTHFQLSDQLCLLTAEPFLWQTNSVKATKFKMSKI